MEQKPSKMQQMTVNWANLPEEAIRRISYELHFYGIDYRSFRSVCRNWRKSLPSFNHFFDVVLPRKIPTKLGFVTLISSITFLLVPDDEAGVLEDQSWLITIDEFDKGKLKLRHPITTNLIDINHDDFPKRLNLFDFDATIVDFGVKLCFEISDEDEVCSYECSRYDDAHSKSVFLWPDFVAVLLFHEKGGLGLLKLNGELTVPEMEAAFRCDDIAKFEDKLVALSHLGEVFVINGFEGKVIDKLCKPCDEVDGANERKRLAVCYEEEKEVLYLIVKKACVFRVYKLSEKLREWERVCHLDNRILFVSYDKCFFVDAYQIRNFKGDCVVFTKNCFASTFGHNSADDELFQGAQDDFKIGVFDLDNNSCQLLSKDPLLSQVIWPPPNWLELFSQDKAWRFEKDEEDDSYYGTDSDFCSEEHNLSATSQHGKNGQGSKDHPPSSNKKVTNLEEVPCEKICMSVPAKNSPRQFSESDVKEKNDLSFDLVPHFPSPKQVGVDSLLPLTSSIKKAKDSSTLRAFQGVDISSEFIPILQKLWDKHGNIIEGHVVHSNGLLTWTLESLAKMVIILKNNTGESLNDSQAEYLKSTLADLQHMHFRLDWLVPFVDRALKVHKSKCQIGIMMGLEARKSKLLAELCELEKQIVQQEKLVVESLSDSTPSLLDKCLAEGLC